MRVSLSVIAAVLLASSGPLALVSASADAAAEPKPDTTPDPTPTPTTTTTTPTTARQAKAARETSANLLSALYQLAASFDLRACIPGALPLVTTLPRIPGALLRGDAVSQALAQTTRGLDGVCDFSVTGPAGDAFTSFLPAWYSWYNRYSDRVATLATKCERAGDLVRTVEAYETCPQVVAQISAASASATATATATAASTAATTSAGGGGSGGDTGGSPASTPSETASTDSPAAAGETGFLGAAAAAAAGILGVVAVL
ncbi:hypothetical protein SAMD00023353_4000630 [Rosellinia necatrix]|uniref:Infection structure specific protein n=1 Tax=Rosellinia necatrix TaxID=77044 RepID=A0A1W2TM77_ROSNE|nr:hypothetical protein SAMD00023353_4000630 [Rosellinia necatrix]